MDLTTYTSTEIAIFCRGYAAAVDGVPFDEHGDAVWQDGHRFGAIYAAGKASRNSRAFPRLVPDTPVDTAQSSN